MFSDSFKENPEVLLMLVLGYSLMAILFYFLHRRGKKRHQFDERYQQITNRFKAKTFDIMWVVLIIAWLIVMMFDGIHFSFWLLTALVFIRGLTMLSCAIIYSEKE